MKIVWMPRWDYNKLLKAGWDSKYHRLNTWRYVPFVIMSRSQFEHLR